MKKTQRKKRTKNKRRKKSKKELKLFLDSFLRDRQRD
jgi:hypothetical protein